MQQPVHLIDPGNATLADSRRRPRRCLAKPGRDQLVKTWPTIATASTLGTAGEKR
jgi:hypothetical protein